MNETRAWVPLLLSLGMGLGRALEGWLGSVCASGVSLALALAAFVLLVRDLRRRYP